MISLLVVTHGNLGEELVEAARRIVREPGSMEFLSIAWDADLALATARIEASLDALAKDDGLIILTDMLGGTPANVAMAFLEPGRVEVITGVNLPMLIKFNNLPHDVDLASAAQTLAKKGKSHITIAGEILATGLES